MKDVNPPRDSRLLYNVCTFVIGTVTSFSCLYFGKAFLTGAVFMSKHTTTSNHVFSSVVVLSLIQLIPCAKVVEFQRVHGDSAAPSISRLVVMGHGLATLATNYSLSLMFASSTLAIKLGEPIVQVLIGCLATGRPLSIATLLGLPVTVGLSVVFVGNPLTHPNLLWGTVAALVSSLGASFRNVALKQMDVKIGTDVNPKLSKKWLCSFVGISVLSWSLGRYLQDRLFLPPNVSYLMAIGWVSALFHVVDFYTSMQEMTLMEADDKYSLTDIPKRLLVVLLLYTFGRRVASTANFLGLVGCMAGLCFFIVYDKKKKPNDTESQEKPLRTNPKIWKYWGVTLIFLLLVLSVGDSSPQSTEFENIVKTPQDQRPLYFGHPPNQGGYSARNTLAAGGQQRPSDDVQSIAKKPQWQRHLNDMSLDDSPDKGGHSSRNTLAPDGQQRPSDDGQSIAKKPQWQRHLNDMSLGDSPDKGGHSSRNTLAPDGQQRPSDDGQNIAKEPQGQRHLNDISLGDSPDKGGHSSRNTLAPDGQQRPSDDGQNIAKEPQGQHHLYDMFRGDPPNKGGYFSRDTFAPDGQQRPSDDELQPVSNNVVGGLTPEIESFLKSRIIDDKDNVNFISQKLTQTSEVIREAQRIHFNLFGDVLKKYKYAILFDVANFENKGDSAISVGEAYFLRRMNLKLLFYASTYQTHMANIQKARILADKFTQDEVVILLQGGGNIIAYQRFDHLRFWVLNVFHDYQVMLFPQSIRPSKNPGDPHTNVTINHYCCQENFTLVLRDQLSYDLAKKLYHGATRLLMAPDMAFQIGRVQRFMSPVFDILWLKRDDRETPNYSIKDEVPRNLRVHVSDWLGFKSPRSDFYLEWAEYVTTQGFFFLQRGRVVITDRLHGHILSTLLDIPHVLIDNDARKLSGYHNTWTKSVENTVITDDPAQALSLAIGLLEKYNDTLPPILPYLDVPFDSFDPVVHGQLIRGYP